MSDLASQLSKIQDENDTIRQRYLELEDAWQTQGAVIEELRAENKYLKDDNEQKTTALAKAEALVKNLEAKLEDVHSSFLEQRNLAEGTKATLISEQVELGRKTKEADLLRRESVTQESELRKLREAWNEREARVSRLEEQRNFYEEQLSQLAEAYQVLVDKVSHVAGDYGMQQAPTQVRVGGGYEVLSNYLGQVFDEKDEVSLKYSRFGNSQAALSPARPAYAQYAPQFAQPPYAQFQAQPASR